MKKITAIVAQKKKRNRVNIYLDGEFAFGLSRIVAAWLHVGGNPKQAGIVRQQCDIGMVDIDISEAGKPAFTAPPTEIRALPRANFDAICDRLEIP